MVGNVLFDVDKLFVARFNYDENGKKIEFDDTLGNSNDGITKWYANATRGVDSGRGAVENRMLDVYLALLSSKHHVSETRASIDTVTEKLKGEVLKEIEDALPKTKDDYAFKGVSPSYHSNKKTENVVSKNGIGPFALANVHHVLTQLCDIRINNEQLDSLGMWDISSIYGRDNFIS